MNGETHTDVLTWTAVSSLSEITKAGHYYLTQSVTQSSEWQPVDGVVLCLNGYDIICSKDGANTIKLANGGSFTLSDCKGTGRTHPRRRAHRYRRVSGPRRHLHHV